MATIWGMAPPAGGGGAVAGDVFVTPAGIQHRWTGSAWVQIVPPTGARTVTSDTRADVIPAGGQLNDRVAKVGGNQWQMGYVNAADGVVAAQHNVASPGQTEWDILHNLGAPGGLVHVLVISPGNDDPTAEQDILVPEVEYSSPMTCKLTFAAAVFGTAIIRR